MRCRYCVLTLAFAFLQTFVWPDVPRLIDTEPDPLQLRPEPPRAHPALTKAHDSLAHADHLQAARLFEKALSHRLSVEQRRHALQNAALLFFAVDDLGAASRTTRRLVVSDACTSNDVWNFAQRVLDRLRAQHRFDEADRLAHLCMHTFDPTRRVESKLQLAFNGAARGHPRSAVGLLQVVASRWREPRDAALRRTVSAARLQLAERQHRSLAPVAIPTFEGDPCDDREFNRWHASVAQPWYDRELDQRDPVRRAYESVIELRSTPHSVVAAARIAELYLPFADLDRTLPNRDQCGDPPLHDHGPLRADQFYLFGSRAWCLQVIRERSHYDVTADRCLQVAQTSAPWRNERQHELVGETMSRVRQAGRDFTEAREETTSRM